MNIAKRRAMGILSVKEAERLHRAIRRKVRIVAGVGAKTPVTIVNRLTCSGWPCAWKVDKSKPHAPVLMITQAAYDEVALSLPTSVIL